MLRLRAFSIAVCLVLAPLSVGVAVEPEAVGFQQDVAPIFAAKCLQCHGEKLQKSELDLRTPESVMRGGASGEIIVPHKPEESLLYEYLRDELMPPEEVDDLQLRLTKAEIATIHDWIAAGAPFAAKPGAVAVAEPVTHDQILPIMLLRCNVCHGPHKREAGLNLSTRELMLSGGRSGPAIVPGKPEESLLVKRIRAEQMPPRRKLNDVSVKPVEPQELELIERWVVEGAPAGTDEEDIATTEPDPLVSDDDRNFWSFQPPRQISPPQVQSAERARNPIDFFVLQKLEAVGLSLAPEADLRTRVRRAYFDLHGLPPTPEEIEAVVNDSDPRAYEKLIDRLLDSPRYGERWGRHWLDLAGYADSDGKTHQDLQRPFAYRYRDYVIRAFNADKRYDRFLLEQLAGDELADYEHAAEITPEIYDNLVATGFLRMAPDGTHAPLTNFVPDRLAVIADELQVLGSAVMGLTIHCARCHSHKFDPLPHRDYYRLAAVFKPAWDEHDWLRPNTRAAVDDRDLCRYLPYVLPEELAPVKAHNEPIKQKIAELEMERERRAREVRDRLLQSHLSELTQTDQQVLSAALATPAPDRDKMQRMWIDALAEQFVLDESVLRKDSDYKQQSKQIDKKITELRGQLKATPLVQAAWDRGSPSPTYILRRGEPTQPTRRVGPGVPSVLTDGRTPFEVSPPWRDAKSTGRRLAFAKWLVRPEHPLTARVMINRIWLHHFGRGIVETPANFGKTGARPTHPELLDWLAVEFIRGGWSIKAMHRLMMTSSTYRQSSEITPEQTKLDPENKLFSRMRLRRAEGEVVRDSVLLVAGRLDETRFGQADPIVARGDGLVTVRGTERGWRRSIYSEQRRTQVATLLESFDLPQMSPNCTQRTVSIVAPQALNLLNDAEIHELSRRFAERVRREAGSDSLRQIDRAFAVALGRAPTDAERRLTAAQLAKLAKTWINGISGREMAIEATTELLVRQVDPDKLYENDLISVWSSASSDGAPRYGLVEFDVSKLAELEIKHAHLELGTVDRGPIRQRAGLIPPGIAGATWNTYQAEKAAMVEPFVTLGRFDLPHGSQSGGYVASQPASTHDLQKLRSATGKSRVAFVLIAEEDGQPYRRDWDDGVGRGTDGKRPRLVVRFGQPDPEVAALRALSNVCHALLNCAEFVYVD